MLMSLGKLWEMGKGREACSAESVGSPGGRHDLVTERQQQLLITLLELITEERKKWIQ